jgi:hypothetical protein
VETRFLTRGADGGWIYASYAWNADESEARLAPELGVIGAAKTHEGARFDIPSRTDCFACHRGGTSEVLGFGALQLSSERDPLAPHAETPPAGAVDLRELLARGLVRNLPQGLVEDPPHVVACTPRARAAIGYLHANCGGCHNATGPLASLGMRLDYSLAAPAHEDALPPAVATTLGCTSRFRACADRDSVRVTAGDVEQSLLYRRLASRNPLLQMPPLGTRLVDQQALSLVTDWIRQDLVASADSPDRNQPRSKE